MDIKTAPELYAHAMALERAAAQQYAKFAAHMADQGNAGIAALFEQLAAFESEHLAALERRTEGVALPRQPDAHDLTFKLMTPRQALAIALEAEQRARSFFVEVQHSAEDPALRALAKEMAAEEDEHIALLVDALSRAHDPFVDWASIFETN